MTEAAHGADDAPDLETVLEELRALRAETETLRAKTDRLETRVADLESELADRDRTIASLEATVDALETTLCERLDEHDDRLSTHADRLEDHDAQLEDHHDHLTTHDTRLESHDTHLETLRRETDRLDALAEATRNRTGANKARLEELQTRELEKGAHLRESNVDVHEIEVPGDRLERVTKSDGERYLRVPAHDDPLERTQDVALAHGDLLPVQQLARLDEDLRRSSTDALPTRLAAKLWEARADPAVDDDPWKNGCKSIREYVTAGDLKHWIRRQEPGTSDAYAKKLVSRTIDAILELSKNRLAVRKRTQRKNGLEYTERRLILPADAEIPGETNRSTSSGTRADSSTPPTDSSSSARSNDGDAPDPETADVLG
ncbi:hypothetical protein [Natronolimnohabitans innermongolicus]|uniref:Uncharacterized protein n=1 Tax=Natronolimnohabitans innermongolicus JCM 12255 TaxID=1227499 RepID=L9WR45_9EURY|nr:hypothetical protein [Natronolimnohabitans innermongolicus]ELY51671.1 hypothetical protein C493_17116 [Natronolimnohabitans innermongolicus JCM 12255]